MMNNNKETLDEPSNTHPTPTINLFDKKKKLIDDYVSENKTILPILFLLNLALSLLYTLFVLETHLYLVYFIYDVVAMGLIVLTLKKTKLLVNQKALLWIVPILLYSFTSKLFNINILPFHILISPILLGIFLLKATNSNFHEILDCTLLIQVLRNFIPNIAITDASFKTIKLKPKRSQKKEPQLQTTIKQVLLGLVIAIPFLYIIIQLLSDSDSNFSNIFHNLALLNLNINSTEFIFKTIFTMIGFVCLSFYATKILSQRNTKPMLFKKKSYPVVACSTFLICLNAVYLVFLYLQIKYAVTYGLFTLPPGLAYYEFAHLAFFNTFFVTIINIIIILFFTEFTEMDFKHNLFKCNFIFIFISTILLIFTALSRMYMYMNEFGFTSLRQEATLGLLLELAIMIFLILRFNFNINFYKMTVIALLTFLITNNVIANDFVSTYLNFKKFNVTPELLQSNEHYSCSYNTCSITLKNHELTFPFNEDSRAYIDLFTANTNNHFYSEGNYYSYYESIMSTIVNASK